MNNRLIKLLGLFLIVIGIGYFGDQMYLWEFTIFFDGWWAVLITIGSLCSMMEDGVNVWNVFLAITGIYFFMDCNNLISFDITFMMVLSIAIIILGVKLLLFKEKPIFVENVKESVENEHDEPKKIYINSAFSTRHVIEKGIINRFRIENFFGNVVVDLTDADLRTLDALSIDSIFGNVEIIVGQDVNLKLFKNRMFSGSYIDRTYCENGYDVFVRGSSIFGNIKINKNKPV